MHFSISLGLPTASKTAVYSIGLNSRPITLASPHLNAKVERSQKTNLEEFYILANLSNFGVLQDKLEA